MRLARVITTNSSICFKSIRENNRIYHYYISNATQNSSNDSIFKLIPKVIIKIKLFCLWLRLRLYAFECFFKLRMCVLMNEFLRTCTNYFSIKNNQNDDETKFILCTPVVCLVLLNFMQANLNYFSSFNTQINICEMM